MNPRNPAKYSQIHLHNIMIPTLPNVCNNYNILQPTFHLPLIKHAIAEQRVDYQLIKRLNTHESTVHVCALKVQSLHFFVFKTFEKKYHILNTNVDRWYNLHCPSCRIFAQRQIQESYN